jgi:hypothetical protein
LEEARRVAESELAVTKEVVERNAQALVDYLGRSKVLQEELGQLRGVARSVVTDVLILRPRSSMLAANLSEIPDEVAGLITDGVALGVLTKVASHYPTLDFEAIGRG